MKHSDESRLVSARGLLAYMGAGALAGFVLISIFLLNCGEADPSWGRFWRVKPLLMVPFAGATGAAFYYFLTYRFARGVAGLAATLIGIVIFIVGLWIGSVLGLNGTYWN